MKQPSIQQLQIKVDNFNRTYKVGDAVKLKKAGQVINTKVKSEATVLGGHSAVAWFEGVSGCYDINCVL